MRFSEQRGLIETLLTSVTKMLYASDLFYLVATFSSRTAVLCLLYALSPEQLHKLVTKSGIIASLVMTVAAVLMVALGCDVGSPWTQVSQECNSVVSYFTWDYERPSLTVRLLVRALDCHRCAQYFPGTIYHHLDPEDALHAATSLDRQAQGHGRLRTKTPVSKPPIHEQKYETHLFP